MKPDSTIYIGAEPLKNNLQPVDGKYTTIDGEKFYKISNYDGMRPFFISLVSNDDHWLFISSTGGLTAGRQDENHALFPYYTDDKIAASAEYTGSKTLLRVHLNNRIYLWEPFSEKFEGIYNIRRNLYKHFAGNKIIFEEINTDLEMAFSYCWQFSEKYGIVKRSEIRNTGSKTTSTEILDGIQNLLPYGVGAALQNSTSNLVNAYKKHELHPSSGLGIFSLSAMIVDKAEPAEALKATTAWAAGVSAEKILLSSLQTDAFRKGLEVHTEEAIRAESGAYFILTNQTLPAGQKISWYIVAEVDQDSSKVMNLISQLEGKHTPLIGALKSDISSGTQKLLHLVAKADGIQLTRDSLSTGRHLSNVLFNIMRGGVFEDQYRVYKNDLAEYTGSMNRRMLNKQAAFFAGLGESFQHQTLIELAHKTSDPDLIRICYEYLPLSFSRRHGDPSRPWNKFRISIKDSNGAGIKNYEGNWRDIFQNWEALATSFPGYILSMVAKFVNASTIDGYNPYRISREGIDWEVIDPEDPWSFIGYWGDHQIIYLLKLLELAQGYQPDDLARLMNTRIFVFANVPYRIKSYQEIVENPKNSILYDEQEEKEIRQRVHQIGADGKLVIDQQGQPVRATLAEKILVPLLAKISNFIPEAGIWLNTQRPEWNDANNALVGNGASMVTLYYMRRYVSFGLKIFTHDAKHKIPLLAPVAEMLQDISAILEAHLTLLANNLSDHDRKSITDQLGMAGESYRKKVYTKISQQTIDVSVLAIRDFLSLSRTWIDHSIRAGKRADGLYHAYNLIAFDGGRLSVTHLYEMLEGQVAVLSAGVLSPEEALGVMNALKNSKMYRADQYSYLLYPDRQLPAFLEKNRIPGGFIQKSKLAQALMARGDTSILQADQNGEVHFSGDFHHAGDLKTALNQLQQTPLADLAKAEYQAFLDAFEDVFNHRAFTGRSGTFFGYEGLGSIYWHMVSKLLLAVQENIYLAEAEKVNREVIGKMVDHYYEIRAGIGINKSPELYGAFPTDPYSHTPCNKGAQQPGLTGQVKEDIINRWAELGLRVEKGCIMFKPVFLHQNEFLKSPNTFSYFDVYGNRRQIELHTNELAFTWCQVPVVYAQADRETIHLRFKNGTASNIEGHVLDAGLSHKVFSRTGEIDQIKVYQKFRAQAENH